MDGSFASAANNVVGCDTVMVLALADAEYGGTVSQARSFAPGERSATAWVRRVFSSVMLPVDRHGWRG